MKTQQLAVRLVLDEASVRAALNELRAASEAAVHVSDDVIERLDHLALRPIEFFQLKVNPPPARGTNELRLTLELTDRALGLVAALRAGDRDRSVVEEARHAPTSVGGSTSVQSEPR